MTGGGIGFDYSLLREEGAKIKRTGGQSTGPIALMAMINEAGRYIMQGGSRRSAIWAGLNWSHGDIQKFLDLKNWSQDIRDLKKKDFNFPIPMELTNISVIYDTEFFIALKDKNHPKYNLAKDIWYKNCLQAFSTAEPGMSFNFRKDNESLRNAPIVGETFILTSTGYKQVFDIVDTPIEVWTGKQWAKTVFKKTREMDETLTVTLTGRKEITCSKDHPFVLNDGSKVQAQNLKIGQEIKVSLGIVEDGIKNNNAFLLGCVYGDGSFHKKYPRMELPLCGDKEKLLNRLELSDIKPISINRDNRGILRMYFGNNQLFTNRNKAIFPTEVFSWDLNSRKAFLEGLLETDGNDHTGYARLSSKHFDFLKNTGRLAESIGLTVALNKGSNGGYIGTPTWNLIIKGDISNLYLERLKLKNTENFKFKIVSIEESDKQDVFCCDVKVPEHSFQAEGLIISNCTEVVSEDDSDKCNLGTMWINRFDNKEEFAEGVEYATLFLLCGSIYSDVPNQKIKEVGLKNNRIGLGLGGIHEWLMLRGQGYEVVPELHKWLSVYEQESDGAAFVGARELNVSVPKGVRAIAPTGSIGIIAETTTGVEPLFCKAYKRRYLGKDKNWQYQYVVDGAVKRLLEKNVKLENIKDAYDISFKERVKFQADVQNYVDMAISSTCNLSSWGSPENNESNLEEKSKILLSYAKRLRGFTCYPDGARDGQPLERVNLEDALKQEGQVFEEVENECLNGICGI
jgi:ribonucleotide reductase alpha subunit